MGINAETHYSIYIVSSNYRDFLLREKQHIFHQKARIEHKGKTELSEYQKGFWRGLLMMSSFFLASARRGWEKIRMNLEQRMALVATVLEGVMSYEKEVYFNG